MDPSRRSPFAESYDVYYFDMDGVITNYPKAHYLAFGKKPEEISGEELWQDLIPKIADGFFLNLEPVNRGMGFLQEGIEAGHNVEILSVCGREDVYEAIKEQKQTWLRKQGISVPCHFVNRSSDKAKYGKPGALLIDDRLKCCQYFKQAGGDAIHFTANYYYGV